MMELPLKSVWRLLLVQDAAIRMVTRAGSKN